MIYIIIYINNKAFFFVEEKLRKTIWELLNATVYACIDLLRSITNPSFLVHAVSLIFLEFRPGSGEPACLRSLQRTECGFIVSLEHVVWIGAKGG